MEALQCEVDCALVAHNIRQYRLPVVLMAKAHCYGLGLEVAKRVSPLVHAFGVAYAEEGAELRAVTDKPILVTTPCWTAAAVERYCLVPMVACKQDAEKLRNLHVPVEVHIAINSGMNRFGVGSVGELREVLAVLAANPLVRVTGAYTHYASAQAYNQQNKRLLPLLAALPRDITLHTRATFTACMQGVGALRVGLGAYRGSVRLTGRVLAVRHLRAGECAGYNGVYHAQKDTYIAVITGGYADGMVKALRGHLVRIGNQLAPIVAVCMDVCLVALPKPVGVGDTVEVLGEVPDPKQPSLYEMYTGLHGRVAFHYKGDI